MFVMSWNQPGAALETTSILGTRLAIAPRRARWIPKRAVWKLSNNRQLPSTTPKWGSSIKSRIGDEFLAVIHGRTARAAKRLVNRAKILPKGFALG